MRQPQRAAQFSEDAMADWVDRRLGGFCQAIQQQIEELPLLDAANKRKFVEMLEECASKADKSTEDSVAFMRREIKPLADQYMMKSGKFLRIG